MVTVSSAGYAIEGAEDALTADPLAPVAAVPASGSKPVTLPAYDETD